MKKNIQQLIVLFAVLVTVISFMTPFQAHAQADVVSDPLTEAWTAITSVGSTASAAVQTSLGIEQITVKDIAIAIAKIILQQLTLSIVNWINTGFNGSPSFVTNPAQFFENVGDDIAGNFLQADGDLRFLCSPFSLDLRIALALKMSQSVSQKYTCTLTGAIKNATNAAENASISGFIQGDFSQGGWPAFMTLTTQPQNNAGGAFLQAESDLATAVSTKVNQKVNELAQGAGFLSKENCTYAETDPDTGTSVEITQTEYNSDVKAGTAQFDSQENCVTTTPGSVAAGVLQKSLGIPADQLLLANDLNAIISAAFSQLAFQVLHLGLSAITGSDSSGGAAYLQTLASQSNTQLQQVQTSTNQSLTPYLTSATQIKASFDSELTDISLVQGNINLAVACWTTYSTTYPDDSTDATSQINYLNQITATTTGPLFAKVTTEDNTASTTLQSITNIEDNVNGAQTATDLSDPGQEIESMNNTTGFPTAVQVNAAATELTTTTATLQPINTAAENSLEQCQQLTAEASSTESTD